MVQPFGTAKAGAAMATIIAAVTKAAVTINMMRLISTTLPVEGRSKKGVKPPLLLASPLSAYLRSRKLRGHKESRGFHTPALGDPSCGWVVD